MKALRITPLLAVLASSAAIAAPTYVTGLWSDETIHILDENFNSLSSFAAGASLPNGVGASAGLIFSGHFVTQEVIAYDFSGTQQYSFSSGSFSGLQGLTVTGTEIAVATNGMTEFYTLGGTFVRSFANSGVTVEGLGFDGTLIWEIGNTLIGRDPLTGAVVRDIPNAALACDFGGTGIADGGANALALACTDGSWFLVSDTTGAVLLGGNNGLNMYGLDNVLFAAVPEPGTLGLLSLGLFGAGALLRRRRVPA